jgi:hypothetical protein
MEYYIITFGIFAFGFYVTYTGIMVRLGRLRKLFLGGSFPVLAQREIFVLSIPMGLGIITVGLTIIFPGWQKALTILLWFFSCTTVILGFWAPGWIKPDWLRWLDDNYGHVREEMFRAARQIGVDKWEEATHTQEGLEHWADSVAQKHGWRRMRRR